MITVVLHSEFKGEGLHFDEHRTDGLQVAMVGDNGFVYSWCLCEY